MSAEKISENTFITCMNLFFLMVLFILQCSTCSSVSAIEVNLSNLQKDTTENVGKSVKRVEDIVTHGAVRCFCGGSDE